MYILFQINYYHTTSSLVFILHLTENDRMSLVVVVRDVEEQLTMQSSVKQLTVSVGNQICQ